VDAFQSLLIQPQQQITTTTLRVLMDASAAASSLGSTTESKENYDIVKVDLENNRDYPIYIGTGYSDQEGMYVRTYGCKYRRIETHASRMETWVSFRIMSDHSATQIHFFFFFF
jgi:hypothetical protein